MNQNTNFLSLARTLRRAIRNMAPVADLRNLCEELARASGCVRLYGGDYRRALRTLRAGCDELERVEGTSEANGAGWNMLGNGARDMVTVAAEENSYQEWLNSTART